MYNKKSIYIACAVVLAVVALALIYFNFIAVRECKDSDCFFKKMESCSKTKFISEQEEASWLYEIIGMDGGACRINVKLLQAKEGELRIESIAGYDMDCYYDSGIKEYPQRDLTKCHGRLKEELQNIIIEKLHSYILKNFGKIEEGLKSAL